MRYHEFRDAIRGELFRHPSGLTSVRLRARLDLPYDRPCPEWTRRLEKEIGLTRTKGEGRALMWKVGRARAKGTAS